MALQVQDQTRQQTSECMFSFQCLEEATRNVCTIKPCLVEEVYFLNTPKNHLCSYKKKIGSSSYICQCPTRKELYRRYRI